MSKSKGKKIIEKDTRTAPPPDTKRPKPPGKKKNERWIHTNIPAISDIVVSIILLVPGFVALGIFRKIAKFDRSLPENETILLSLFVGFVILGIYNYGNTTADLETILKEIFLTQNMFKIVVIATLPAILLGFTVRKIYRDKVISDDVWELSFKNASKKGSWIIVYTNDGEEYMGALHHNSGSDEPREVTIRDPIKIVRLENEEYDEIE